jgi:hypothetical protein
MESHSPLPALALEAAIPTGHRAQRIAQIKFVALPPHAVLEVPGDAPDLDPARVGTSTGAFRAAETLRALLRRIGIRAN